MENTKLVFVGNDKDCEMQVYYNTKNEIYIEIKGAQEFPEWITLNRDTAIKLSKELKKQISYLND